MSFGRSALLVAGLASATMAVAQPRPPVPQVSPIDMMRSDFAARSGGSTVYFGAGSAQIGAPASAVLAAQAMWIRQHPNVSVRIEGSADPGDTRDHALAMGARRANEVRNYFVLLGVPAAQLSATSWGKEHPGSGRTFTNIIGPGPLSGPASAISRAVISIAISARHSWPRVDPDKAARLNHLCASTRSTAMPAWPVE